MWPRSPHLIRVDLVHELIDIICNYIKANYIPGQDTCSFRQNQEYFAQSQNLKGMLVFFFECKQIKPEKPESLSRSCLHVPRCDVRVNGRVLWLPGWLNRFMMVYPGEKQKKKTKTHGQTKLNNCNLISPGQSYASLWYSLMTFFLYF